MESLCIRVPKKAAEETRRKLIELGAIDKNLKIRPEDEYLLIPITRSIAGYNIEKGDFELLKKEKSPAKILGFFPKYEQIGDIAIIDRYEPEAQRIAEVLIRQNKIKTVLQAETSISGEYRTRELSVLAGERRTETLYKENGCRYLLDLARVYFTPRLATERMRIANQIHNGDKVVDMFAGVGPFSILIAKRFPAAHVVAIDKNPDAINYLKKNVKLNKVKNVEIREGDARDIAKEIREADHVIMNLPHSGLEFLEAAFGMVSYLSLKAVKLPDSTTKLASDSHNQTSRGSISSGVNSIRTVPTNTENDLKSYIPIAANPRGTQKIHPTAKAGGLSLPLDSNAVEKGGVIHFYAITHEDELFEGILKKIEEIARKLNLRIIPLDKRIVRPYAPYQYNICIDFQVI